VTTLASARSRPGVRVHRTLSLDAIRRDPEHGLPATTPSRTIRDLAPALTDHRLERLLHRAEHLRLLDARELRTSPRLRRALDSLSLGPPQITRSELEELFLELMAQAEVPRPLVNHERGRYTSDFVWPDVWLVVETDGARTHNTDTAFVADRRRDVELKLAGWETLRFTWHDVAGRRAWVAGAVSTTWAARASARRRS
jgi:hypothetical protein